MAKSKLTQVNEDIAKAVTGAYQAVERGVVGAYRKVEDGFVEQFLAHEGESPEEAKARLKQKDGQNL